MSKRYAIMYHDGSFNISKSGLDLIDAPKWLGYEHADEHDKLVEVEIKVTKIINERNPGFQVATEHSANCPTCGTEVFVEVPNAKA